MKKILTAIGNTNLNEKLRNIENLDVIDKDILYKEGILEFLEEDASIDIVILNEELCTERLEEFLYEIVKFNVEVYLLLADCSSYYKEEFDNLKNVKIFKSEEEIILEFDDKYMIRCDYTEHEFKKNKRVISVLGSNGCGKTVISSILAKKLAKQSRVLIIDFDILGNNLSYLFNVDLSIKTYHIENLIEKVEKNLYILKGIKYIFNENNKINSYKVKELIEKLKREYDYIFIDTSSEIYLKYVKTIIPNCDYNLFILEGNSLEVKKAKALLELYTYDFELDLSKTGIIINKENSEMIDIDILKEVFEKIKIIGRIKYYSKMNSYINSYTKNLIKIEDIQKIERKLEGD